MGCHTWFNNALDKMPEDHIIKQKKISLDLINKNKILSCDYNKWIKTLIDWKLDGETFKKFSNKEFYEERVKHLKWAKSILEAEDMDINTLKIVFKEFGELVFDDHYDLGVFGWHDQFRVSGYPPGEFHSANETIEFLRNYNQDMIQCDMKTGMCEEIEDIINKFFKEYPNGFIEYG